jgi:hypothetical protein
MRRTTHVKANRGWEWMESDKVTLACGIMLALISIPVLFLLVPSLIVHHLPAAFK